MKDIYVLVILEAPVGLDLSEGTAALRGFAAWLENSDMKSPEVQRFNVGAYLLPLLYGTDSLAAIQAEARQRAFGVRTLFFNQEPLFINSEAQPVPG
jgi:hypothetical protein